MTKGVFFLDGKATQLLGSRRDEKAGAMSEFAEKQGEDREAGSRNFSVRKNICDRIPVPEQTLKNS
jgi:hypothetical protein